MNWCPSPIPLQGSSGGKFDAGGAFSPPAGSVEALKADRLCRHHDIYLAPIQGCMYKASPAGQAYGAFPTRDAALDEFQKQLKLIERYADARDRTSAVPRRRRRTALCFPL